MDCTQSLLQNNTGVTTVIKRTTKRMKLCAHVYVRACEEGYDFSSTSHLRSTDRCTDELPEPL